MNTLIAAVTVLAVSTAGAGTVYVDDDAALGGDGSAWGTAYRFLQDALADAAASAGLVTEIRLAQGIYKPDQDESGNVTAGDREATLQLLSGVALLGGFAGIGEPDPDARDISLYVTVLSGDLLGNDKPDFVNNDENSYHITTASLTDATAVMSGITLSDGNANGPSARLDLRRGGAMYTVDGAPTVIDCVFRANAGQTGGAIYNEASSPTITNCLFDGNHAIFSSGSGGAMANLSGSSPVVSDCTFTANAGTVTGRGGAIFNRFSSHPVVTDCTFQDNTCGAGGALANSDGCSPLITRCLFIGNTVNTPAGWGGALWSQNFSSPTVTDCSFFENSAAAGGAVLNQAGSDATYIACFFVGNTADCFGGAMFTDKSSPRIVGCTFITNMVLGANVAWGGAMHNRGGCCNLDTDPEIINSVFVGNSALTGGAISNAASNVLIADSTIAANTAQVAGGVYTWFEGVTCIHNSILWSNDVGQIVNEEAGTTTATYSLIEAGYPGPGNIDADPLFVDPDNGDFRVSADSPCIDAGDNTAVPQDITTDLDGNPRFLEIPETPDTGNGTLPIVDMGAYESLGDGCLAVTGQEIVCHADGTTFTVNIEGLNACTGGTSMITFTASGGAVGEEMCFTLLVNDGGFCCSTEICVTIPDCTAATLPSDLNGDGMVGLTDFLALLGAWGSCSDCGQCPADFDGDCMVGILDLLILLGSWD